MKTCYVLAILVVLLVGTSGAPAHAQTPTVPSAPTGVPTSTPIPPVPTILPDQTLASLPLHGTTLTALGKTPTGWGFLGVLMLWICLWLITSLPK
jgi:hypothetical protein